MRKTGSLKIVYIGWLSPGQTSLQRLRTLERLGHSVTAVDATPTPKPWILELPHRVSGKLFRLGFDAFGPRDRNGENACALKLFRGEEFDILWVDKGTTVEVDTLAEVRRLQPSCRIIGYSVDDMTCRDTQSRLFLQSLPLYDVFFTTKANKVGGLGSIGAKKVCAVGNAYDPTVHRPLAVNEASRARLGGTVGFIGRYESQRSASMVFLGANGLAVRIWGAGWPSMRGRKGVRTEGVSLWGDDYTLAICAFDINLGFLSKINGDLQTTRSVEIPACSAFLLAERTDEHRALFEEGKEAEYFESNEELLDKVQYYLSHEDERKRIAAAGRQRCIRSGYSNDIRLSKMLEIAMKEL